jgi:uncharacterized protein YecE (DUF72 family)
VYSAKAPKTKWLNHCSTVFNTVEGNSTFYGIPAPETFQRWANQTAEGFRFALKFPRSISHEAQLVGAEVQTDQFLSGLSILHQANRLGTTFLQLSPNFSPIGFAALESYLRSLPTEMPFAVEVRHHDWFAEPAESRLNSLLRELQMDRVIFDSRPLYASPPSTQAEQVSQTRKPKVPIRTDVTSDFPMLRLVGRDDVSLVQPWIDEWVPIVAGWIGQGLQPFVFTHTPNDQFAPELARDFHNALAKAIEQLEPQNGWPFEQPKQQNLF